VLEIPAKQGETSLRVQLEAVERQTGHHDPRLDSVHRPEGFEYIFDTYWKIRRGQAISYGDLADYTLVTGIELDAFEIEAMFAMDAALEAHLSERMKTTS